MKQSLIVTLCCVAAYATHVAAEKQEFNFDDTQSIVVKVSETGLTRISVQGDRLREVIGLDDTVVVDKDEANGHLFLKGVRIKQTITVVTEGGKPSRFNTDSGSKRINLDSFKTRESSSKSGYGTHAFVFRYLVSPRDDPSSGSHIGQ